MDDAKVIERAGREVERVWQNRDVHCRPESDISVLFRAYARAAIEAYESALSEAGYVIARKNPPIEAGTVEFLDWYSRKYLGAPEDVPDSGVSPK